MLATKLAQMRWHILRSAPSDGRSLCFTTIAWNADLARVDGRSPPLRGSPNCLGLHRTPITPAWMPDVPGVAPNPGRRPEIIKPRVPRWSREAKPLTLGKRRKTPQSAEGAIPHPRPTTRRHAIGYRRQPSPDPVNYPVPTPIVRRTSPGASLISGRWPEHRARSRPPRSTPMWAINGHLGLFVCFAVSFGTADQADGLSMATGFRSSFAPRIL